ncbi:hypothetical protein ACFDTO_17130 [Microbacteriaceae bacterium 4G12]
MVTVGGAGAVLSITTARVEGAEGPSLHGVCCVAVTVTAPLAGTGSSTQDHDVSDQGMGVHREPFEEDATTVASTTEVPVITPAAVPRRTGAFSTRIVAGGEALVPPAARARTSMLWPLGSSVAVQVQALAAR